MGRGQGHGSQTRRPSYAFSDLQPQGPTPELPLLLASFHQTRQSGPFPSVLPASASLARPGGASVIHGGETGSGSGPGEGGHSARKHGECGAQWPDVRHTGTPCTRTLSGGPGWGWLPVPRLGPGDPRWGRSLCHGSVPVFHIKFTPTGDHTALCKARPPAAALQVEMGVPRAPKGGAQEAAGVGDTQA